jgi:hypothetical protein
MQAREITYDNLEWCAYELVAKDDILAQFGEPARLQVVYMYVHVCSMYMYICLHMHTHIHKHTRTYVCMTFHIYTLTFLTHLQNAEVYTQMRITKAQEKLDAGRKQKEVK